MAKKEKVVKTPKEPGRIKQLLKVYRSTAKSDSNFIWVSLLALIVPLSLGVTVSFVFFRESIITFVLWTIATVLVSVLIALSVMSRRAERAAYSNIQGQAGAVGAVISTTLKRGWISSDMPVAVNPKSRDAIYRAVGKAGVVLVAEGPISRTKQMVEDEKKKVLRAIPGVTIQVIRVSSEPEGTPLYKLTPSIYKLPKTLSRAEISVVNKRLSALGMNLPIPKGIDPNRMRPSHR
jgi:hypothetical protein